MSPKTVSKLGTAVGKFDTTFTGHPAADYLVVAKAGGAVSAEADIFVNGVRVLSRDDLEQAKGSEVSKRIKLLADNKISVRVYGSVGSNVVIAIVSFQYGQVSIPGLDLNGLQFSLAHAEGTVSSSGQLGYPALTPGLPQVLFLESPQLSDAIPVLVPDTAGPPVVISTTLVASTLVALSPSVGPIAGSELQSFFASIENLPSMVSLEREVANAIAAGKSTVDWPAADAIVASIVAELANTPTSGLSTRAPIQVQRPFGSNCPGTQPGPSSRTPIVCRDPSATWGIDNPRPVFLGVRIDGAASVSIDPAAFQSVLYFFRTTSPIWTPIQSVTMSSPHQLELTDGFGGFGDLRTTGMNASLVIGKSLQAFGVPAIEAVNCGAAVFSAGGSVVAKIAANVTNAVANWRGSGDISLFLSALQSVTNLIGTCVQAAVGPGNSASTRWWANTFRLSAKLLRTAAWVVGSGSVSELTWVLAALVDPLPSNDYAFFDDGVGHLTVSGAAWITSNVVGAIVQVNGVAAGYTPAAVIDLPLGVVPVSVSASGYNSVLSSIALNAGHWVILNAALSPIVSPPGSVTAFYPLDASAYDTSGNSLHGTVVGATPTADRYGIADHAMSFNGVNAEIRLPAASTNGLTSGTISLWLRTYDSNSQYNFFAKETGTPVAYPLRAQFGGGPPIDTWCFIVNAVDCAIPKNTFVTPSPSYGFTGWHMYTFTWSPTGIDIYFDATLQKSIPGAWVAPTSGELVLSPPSTSSNGTFERLRGAIDDVQIYPRTLTAAEIVRLMGPQAAPGPPGLVAFYPLDGDGTDASGNGNHGTLSGPTAATGHTGQVGTALSFVGPSDVQIPSNALLKSLTGDLTLVYWVKKGANAIQATMIPVSRREFANRIHFLTYAQPGGFGFQCCSSGGSATGMFYAPTGNGLATIINDGNWHQIAVTRRFGTGGFTEVFVDGSVISGTYTSGTAAALAPVIDADLLIGRQASSANGQFAGLLDDVYIFSSILTQSQIRSLP